MRFPQCGWQWSRGKTIACSQGVLRASTALCAGNNLVFFQEKQESQHHGEHWSGVVGGARGGGDHDSCSAGPELGLPIEIGLSSAAAIGKIENRVAENSLVVCSDLAMSHKFIAKSRVKSFPTDWGAATLHYSESRQGYVKTLRSELHVSFVLLTVLWVAVTTASTERLSITLLSKPPTCYTHVLVPRNLHSDQSRFVCDRGALTCTRISNYLTMGKRRMKWVLTTSNPRLQRVSWSVLLTDPSTASDRPDNSQLPPSSF